MQNRNLMPLVHQVRRTWRNRMNGNPFATDAVIARTIDDLTEIYLRTRSEKVAKRLMVEIGRLELLI